MLNEIIVTNPNAIVEGTDEDLLANLEHIEIQTPETLSAQMQLVREGNKAAIAAVISPGVRILTQTKTVNEFTDYLHELDLEVINFNMAMKP